MSLDYGFYNSVNGDRKYDAVQMSSIFDGVVNDGVFKDYGGGLEVRANGNNSVTVQSGRAWFNHTWTHNPSTMTVSLSSPDYYNSRYDAIILEVNSNTRVNSIKAIKGTASSSPSKPSMVKSGGVYQYPLAYIYRPEGSSSTSGRVQDMRGSDACPWVTSPLSEATFGAPENHNNIFRGKNLGTTVTSAQKTAIRNGTFKDLYIGDYWYANGTKWMISLLMENYLYVFPDKPIRTMVNANFGMGLTNLLYDNYKSSIPSAISSAALSKTMSFEDPVMHYSGVKSYSSHTTTGFIPSVENLFGATYDSYETQHQQRIVQFAYEQAVQHPLFRLAPKYTYDTAGDGHFWTSTYAGNNRLYIVQKTGNDPAHLSNIFTSSNSNVKPFVRLG